MKIYDVVIVGAGFTGLSAAYTLAKSGKKVCLVESDDRLGGLASTFDFTDNCTVEKFYHHWFNSDNYVQELISELDLEDRIMTLPTRTGMFYNGQIWRLSSPLDLLKFDAISFLDRVRLGLVTLWVKRIKNWKKIEHLSIREWLEPLCGKKTYSVVWEPLIRAKFSNFSESVSAVWMWKKLVLRGGTRNKSGKEELLYFEGGFGNLAKEIMKSIKLLEGELKLNFKVTNIETHNGDLSAVVSEDDKIYGKKFLFTTPLPITAKLLNGVAQKKWLDDILKISYLGNICLVLRLSKSLSDTYWMNVNDPEFPFVGVIEHTNFDTPSNYDGSHIAYLSRYIATSDEDWALSDSDYFNLALTYLQKMFPDFQKDWVIEYKIWRSEHAQPVAEKKYSQILPPYDTPIKNLYIATMAQIYPEDRGTNYAVREGKKIAENFLLD